MDEQKSLPIWNWAIPLSFTTFLLQSVLCTIQLLRVLNRLLLLFECSMVLLSLLAVNLFSLRTVNRSASSALVPCLFSRAQIISSFVSSSSFGSLGPLQKVSLNPRFGLLTLSVPDPFFFLFLPLLALLCVRAISWTLNLRGRWEEICDEVVSPRFKRMAELNYPPSFVRCLPSPSFVRSFQTITRMSWPERRQRWPDLSQGTTLPSPLKLCSLLSLYFSSSK